MEILFFIVVVILVVSFMGNSNKSKGSKQSNVSIKKTPCTYCGMTGKVEEVYTERDNHLSGARMVEKRRTVTCPNCLGKGHH
ncbi:hypothetical protein DFP76_10577 [Marinomonas aquiplantarum]|uniref:Uncharacterized protein n=1 Tax=Marinomonas aquiplantarum TaxID=491951 RepID=A0A366CXQ1_9GAMM|nr:hypothetical protein DFP76_10577 [Marinomonas aquiplantarum]